MIDLKGNAERFSGSNYVKLYDQYRPSPPEAILHQTLNYLGRAKADLLVDLGCGSGKGTFIWAKHTDRIIGVEPSDAMLQIAQQKIKENDNIQFRQGFGHAIPLPDACADIVTCSQSFHWMEPESTLSEINRILKPKGVLVIYDVQWPPSVNTALEIAYADLFHSVKRLTASLDQPRAKNWPKDNHLKNIIHSNYFEFCKSTHFHKSVTFDPELFIGIALSQGGLETLLKAGITEATIGIPDFIQKVQKQPASPYPDLIFNYQTIFAVK